MHVLPLTVQLNFFLAVQIEGTILRKMFFLFKFVCGTPPGGWWAGGLQHFSVSPSPLWF